MFVSVRSRLLHRRVPCVKYRIQKYTASEVSVVKNEDGPKYPPIVGVDPKTRKKIEHQKWYDEIQKIETVEEKLIKLNMPRYYGWKVLLYEEEKVPYDGLSQVQHATRTCIEHTGLPSFYDNIVTSEELDSIVHTVRKQIEDVIIFENSSRKRRHELNEDVFDDKEQMENIIAKAVTSQIHRILAINLASKLPHLIETHVEHEPRIESCWSMGGVPPSLDLRKLRERKFKLDKDIVNGPTNIWVQYLGHPMFHLRHKYPLQPILEMSECKYTPSQVPTFNYDPRSIGHKLARRHITSIPGFWPGDAHEFGLLSYHDRSYLHHVSYAALDEYDILTTQAVLASFAWLNSQVFYQGFTTFHDVSYPLVSQTIITNSQLWSFYVYQLNTLLMHSDHVYSNARCNMCWATKPMKLYDKVEDNKLHGFNDEVLEHIIKMYMNSPKERENVDLKPFLGNPVKVIADIEDEARRDWLEQIFKHLVSNRPRHKRIPEIYAWQKIYILDHKIRLMEKKLQPWQKGINIYRRRLDDHLPVYVPRKHRDPSAKRRKFGRFKPTFYP